MVLHYQVGDSCYQNYYSSGYESSLVSTLHSIDLSMSEFLRFVVSMVKSLIIAICTPCIISKVVLDGRSWGSILL